MDTEFDEVEENNLNKIRVAIRQALKKYEKKKDETVDLLSMKLLFFMFCFMIYLCLSISLDIYSLIINNKYTFEICASRTIYFILFFIIQLIFSENEKLWLQEYKTKSLKRYMIINICSNIGIKISTIIIIINIIFFVLTYLIKNMNFEKEIMIMNLLGIGSNIIILDIFIGIILLKNKKNENRKNGT
jgi:hypothetical protein